MTYRYDILLNFKDELYDFYDWNKIDNIIHIRKIPVLKIDTKDLINIKNNNIIIDEKILEQIKNKAEIFTPKNIKKMEYMFLLSDGKYVLGILKQGRKIKKSSLLIDEEMDILDEIDNLEKINIDYKIIAKEYNDELKTRKQKETEKFLKKELNKIKNEDDKLKYLYYECFNEKEENIEKIIYKIKESISNLDINKKLYNFFKLIEVYK